MCAKIVLTKSKYYSSKQAIMELHWLQFVKEYHLKSLVLYIVVFMELHLIT